jgi:hypothetical protein
LALFTLFYDLAFPNISIFTLLSFIEFLYDNALTVPTIKNYISSIKTKFSSSNVSVEVFNSPQCSLTLSSLSKIYTPPISIKPVFSPQQLVRLVTHCAHLPLHTFYSAAFIFAYMALLRISNVAHPSALPSTLADIYAAEMLFCTPPTYLYISAGPRPKI